MSKMTAYPMLFVNESIVEEGSLLKNMAQVCVIGFLGPLSGLCPCGSEIKGFDKGFEGSKP
ncbi:MAG: hypothetical protein EA402_04255 [Planctomycetota bacterium]|nr:MAG: hypothetical protein EA402_04255 [Planctomycetota bacterium]